MAFNWSDGFVYTSPVGSFKANAFGLYDMIGNAWQLCDGWYGSYPNEDQTDPTGAAQGSSRVSRGGSWYENPHGCRSGYRFSHEPNRRAFDIGFRVVLEAQ